jgi:hypothetical protein
MQDPQPLSLHLQDKQLIYSAFPSLSKGLAPMAAAHGLKALELPPSLKVQSLGTASLVDAALSSLMAPLDDDPNHCLCISMDAEWNVSRTLGVSVIQIAPHSEPNSVFIIPVRCVLTNCICVTEHYYRFTDSKIDFQYLCCVSL